MTDAISIFGAIIAGYVMHGLAAGFTARAATLSAIVALVWVGSVRLPPGSIHQIVNDKMREFRRLATASLMIFGSLALVSIVLQVAYPRDLLLSTLPVGFVALVVTRLVWANCVVRCRLSGAFKTNVLVVGGMQAGIELAEAFENDISSEYELVGIRHLGRFDREHDDLILHGRRIPVFGDEQTIVDAARKTGATGVVVVSTEQLGSQTLQKLIWDLDEIDARVIVAPGVSDVASPRMSVRPVAGTPLVIVDRPQYASARTMGKAIFDRVFAVFALVAFSPLMIVTAVAIKLESRGPVFYRSERMGIHGRPFQMIKYRSMVENADQQVYSLIDASGGSREQLLFKMHNDPRITRVGRVIRKLSIDELPQLFNVLTGEMSIVGPRPPLAREVAVYTSEMSRRLLVRPGVTGLWQVSGRSNLSVEQSMQLDLYYVDNWSMSFDLAIIAKTVRAVLSGSGAY
ncbi:MAG: sugar transferase [Nocardiaceae bacterium]|nr:sugar transferase [Nocardiaceae bacterium]